LRNICGSQHSCFHIVYPDFVNGVRVGVSDRDGDGKADLLLAAPGPDRTQEVILFDTSLIGLDHFSAFDKAVTSGVFVGR
jgi:FG-GAP repeat